MFIGQTVYSFDDWGWLLVVFESSPQILRVDLTRLRDLLIGYGGAVRRYLVDFLNRHQQLPVPTMLVMTRPHRLELVVPASTYTLPVGVSNLHISRVQGLYVQSYGVRNREECTRCASENADAVFWLCTSAEPFGQGACGNCLWQQNAQGCSRKFFLLIYSSYTLLTLKIDAWHHGGGPESSEDDVPPPPPPPSHGRTTRGNTLHGRAQLTEGLS